MDFYLIIFSSYHSSETSTQLSVSADISFKYPLLDSQSFKEH